MKEQSKLEIILTDMIWVLLFLLTAFGFLAIAVVGGFIAISSAAYLIKSFYFDTPIQIISSLAICILMLASCTLFSYIEVVIFRVTKKGVKRYICEHKIAWEKTKK